MYLVTANICIVDWAFNGTQLVVGTENGKLKQYDLSGQIQAEVPHPGEEVLSSYVIAVSWIDPDMFLVIYSSPPAPDEHQYDYFIVRRSETSFTFSKIVELCPPFGLTARKGWWYSLILRNWHTSLENLLIVASTPSIDISLMTPEHTFYLLEDTKRATLPYHNQSDTSPTGLALDFTAVDKILAPMPAIEECAPQPFLWLLNDQGQLKIWNLMWYDGIKDSNGGAATLLENCKIQVEVASKALALPWTDNEPAKAELSPSASPLGGEFVEVQPADAEKSSAEDKSDSEKDDDIPEKSKSEDTKAETVVPPLKSSTTADKHESIFPSQQPPTPFLGSLSGSENKTAHPSPSGKALASEKTTVESAPTTSSLFDATKTTSSSTTSSETTSASAFKPSSLFEKYQVATEPSTSTSASVDTPAASQNSAEPSLFSKYASAPPLGAGSGSSTFGTSKAPAFGQSSVGTPAAFGSAQPVFGQTSFGGQFSAPSLFGQKKPSAPAFGSLAESATASIPFASFQRDGSATTSSTAHSTSGISGFGKYASGENPLSTLAKEVTNEAKSKDAESGEPTTKPPPASAKMFSVKDSPASSSLFTAQTTAKPSSPGMFSIKGKGSGGITKKPQQQSSPAASAFGARLGMASRDQDDDDDEDETSSGYDDVSGSEEFDEDEEISEEAEDEYGEDGSEEYDEEEDEDAEFDEEDLGEEDEDEGTESEHSEDTLAATMNNTRLEAAKAAPSSSSPFSSFTSPTLAIKSEVPTEKSDRVSPFAALAQKSDSTSSSVGGLSQETKSASPFTGADTQAKRSVTTSSFAGFGAATQKSDSASPFAGLGASAQKSETASPFTGFRRSDDSAAGKLATTSAFSGFGSTAKKNEKPLFGQGSFGQNLGDSKSPFSGFNIVKGVSGESNSASEGAVAEVGPEKKENRIMEIPAIDTLSLTAESNTKNASSSPQTEKETSSYPEAGDEAEESIENLPLVPDHIVMNRRPLSENEESEKPSMTGAFEKVYFDTSYEIDIAGKNATSVAAYVQAHTSTDDSVRLSLENLSQPEIWKMDECATVGVLIDAALEKVRQSNESRAADEAALYEVAASLIKRESYSACGIRRALY